MHTNSHKLKTECVNMLKSPFKKKTIPYIIYKHYSYYFFSSFLIDFLYCIHTFKNHITTPEMNSSLVNNQMVIHTQLVNHGLKPLDLTHGQCSWCGKYGHRQSKCPYLR
ncbi:hypothetical protein BCV71DRAFT_127826 [Rhizopus microsporus]|uniref:CCHC-type domain-containing protein n=1 Tax=Rhizopus microsporus TaxID=58291 RepID=A0A1X0S000_RHIZD|nr:hypothetical protein BCV71DRAFT_127826 [Rhizopus microsporus]